MSYRIRVQTLVGIIHFRYTVLIYRVTEIFTTAAFAKMPARGPEGAAAESPFDRLPPSCERCGAPTKVFHMSLAEAVILCSTKEVSIR